MLYDLLVIAAVIGCGWLGIRLGVAAAAAAALELLACVIAAVVLHEPVIAAVDGGLRAVFGELVPTSFESWLYPVVFATLAWGAFAGLRSALHRGGLLPAEERDDAPLEQALAAVAGGIAGIVAAGGMLVNLSMLPILPGIKPVPQHMHCDAGSLVLRSAAAFAGNWHEGRSLPVDGEPSARSSMLSARLSSEPWSDSDGDDVVGAADRYSDVDGSGGHTPDLYYVDIDGNQVRRIGLIDKYRAASWDFTLKFNDRERVVEPRKPTPVTAPVTVRPTPSGTTGPQPATTGTTVPSGTMPPSPGPRETSDLISGGSCGRRLQRSSDVFVWSDYSPSAVSTSRFPSSSLRSRVIVLA